MTSEERLVTTRLTRRQFMGATAAATVAAFVEGREPRLLAAPAPVATADAVIVLWMAGGMAQTETFDPKTLHAVRTRREGRTGPQHLPDDRHRGRSHQVHARTRAGWQGHRSRRGDTDVHGGGPGLHPALAPSVSLAHRLHPAASDGHAPLGLGRREDARPEESDHARLRRDRPEHGDRRRERRGQGISHRRVPGRRTRPVPDRQSARRGGKRAAGQRARRAALHHSSSTVRATGRAASRPRNTPATFSASRSSARSIPPTGSSDRRRRRPSTSRSSPRRPSTRTIRVGSARVACWPDA